MMMESYELSPEITLRCSADVNKLCEGGHMDQGKTLHCLMNHARTQDGPLSEGCQNAVSLSNCFFMSTLAICNGL